MKQKLFLFFSIFFFLFISCSPKTSSVEDLINAFKSGKANKIAGCFDFPYKRDYPFETIENKNEFIKVFNEVLDEDIIRKIAESNPEEWQRIGWRGLTLGNGDVWLNDNYKISAVNIKTKDYEARLEEKILLDKETLPLKLQDFKQPVEKYIVDGYTYRIDQLYNGKFRLLILTANGIMFSLENGILSFDGSAGSHYYTWNDFDGTNHIIYEDVFNDEVIYSVFMPEVNSENVDSIWKNIAKKLR